MEDDHLGPERVIGVDRNGDQVRQLRRHTSNFSLMREDHAEDVVLDRLIGELNAFHGKHGLLSDEFCSL